MLPRSFTSHLLFIFISFDIFSLEIEGFGHTTLFNNCKFLDPLGSDPSIIFLKHENCVMPSIMVRMISINFIKNINE